MSPSSSRTAPGSISLRSGARASPRLASQYAKNSRLDGCFIAKALPLRPARWDTSVPLSRTRIPLFVVQDRLCSVHAADAFPGDRRRLCAINVKLTMRLGIGAGLLGSNARRFLGAYSAKVGTGFAIGTRASCKLRAFSFGKP